MLRMMKSSRGLLVQCTRNPELASAGSSLVIEGIDIGDPLPVSAKAETHQGGHPSYLTQLQTPCSRKSETISCYFTQAGTLTEHHAKELNRECRLSSLSTC